MQNQDDLCVVVKSEASLGNLKTVFEKAGEVTPVKKILLAHGFIPISRGSPGTFIIRTNQLPEEYRNTVSEFFQEVIVPEVKAEWKVLQSKYDFKRLKKVTYAFVAFSIKRDQMIWDSVNTQFKPQVDDLLISLNIREAAQAIASHIYEIPTILKKMEIDALVDRATDSMKMALRNLEEIIRAELKAQGTVIDDVSDYRKVDAALLAESITKLGDAEVARINPDARSGFDHARSLRIAREIVKNADDLYNLVNGLGVTL